MEAVFRKGIIEPIGPLPNDWVEGLKLRVDPLEQVCEIDAWYDDMNRLCADSTDENEAIMRQTIDAHRQEAKRQMSVQMGLSK